MDDNFIRQVTIQFLVSIAAGLVILVIQGILQISVGFSFPSEKEIIVLDGFMGRLFYIVAVTATALVGIRSFLWGLSEIQGVGIFNLSARIRILFIMIGAPTITGAAMFNLYSATNWLFFGVWEPLPTP